MIEKKPDLQFSDNYWFSVGIHIDHKDPSITLHLPGVIICVGNCKQPGFRYSVRRMLGFEASPFVDNTCDCCGRDNVPAFDMREVDFTDHKGRRYDFLCNRCFVELGGWEDVVEDVTPEQLNQIIELAGRQYKSDGVHSAIVENSGLRHYELRQLFYYYEVVMGGGYGE